jgi:NADH-quinone oxidoreductase subunit I
MEIPDAAGVDQLGGGGRAGHGTMVLFPVMNILGKTYQGLKGLLSGMGLTLGYFLRWDKVITQQYPENRKDLKLPPRTHTRIELVKEADSGRFRCNACGICVRACPNNSIAVEKERDPVTGKSKLTKYVYHYERCTLCGLCVDACRSEALQMGQDFETAVFDSSELVLILNEPETPLPTPANEGKPSPAKSDPPRSDRPSTDPR